MAHKTNTYWQEIRPLWWTEIKLWFGWTDWLNAIFKTGTQLGGLIGAYYITKDLNDLIGSIAFHLGQAIFLFLCIYLIWFVTYMRASKKLYDNQQNEIWRKTENIQKLTAQNPPLKLYVSWGRNFTISEEGGNLIVNLAMDVRSDESRKILDLEAYFSSIEQMTENRPPDWSFTNSFSIFRKYRLEWKGAKYNIELSPGFPETYISIVNLDCTIPEMKFIHEGKLWKIPELQQDAIYKIVIRFRGKLEGDDPSYREFYHNAYFVASPMNSQIGKLSIEKDNQNLPNWLRERIGLTLEKYDRV